jgi:catechol 2,3-dioxygenase-like lactoylglutathione lyase family enzyme
MDYAIQVITLSVTDVDKAAAFYTQQAGFTLDVDYHAAGNFRVVQLTPPGSTCSVQIGVGLTDSPAGSAGATCLVVTDIEAAPRELIGLGVAVSDIAMGEDGYGIVILGGGSGGYACASRASELGKHVALIEKDKVGTPACTGAVSHQGAAAPRRDRGPGQDGRRLRRPDCHKPSVCSHCGRLVQNLNSTAVRARVRLAV